MRILWIDSDDSPWLDADGWEHLKYQKIEVVRAHSVEMARGYLAENFDLFVFRAEEENAVTFLEEVRCSGEYGRTPVVLLSNTWKKSQFKQHSQSMSAADRYAKIPMPADGFVEVAKSLVPELQEAAPEAFEPNGDIDMASSLLSMGQDDGLILQEDAPLISQPIVPPLPPQNVPIAAPVFQDTGSGELDTLKKYLHIRDQELSAAMAQKEEYERQYKRIEEELVSEQERYRELVRKTEYAETRLAQLEEKNLEQDKRFFQEKENLLFEMKAAQEKIRHLEGLLGDSNERYEALKLRVRKDLRQIRVRERELEARLELLRKDSETLMQARDKRILELQRKIDALEFDIDQVQDRRVQAEMEAERYVTKLSRLARTLNLAIGTIEDSNSSGETMEEMDLMMGGAVDSVQASESQAAPASTPATQEAQNGGAAADDHSPNLESLASDGDATRVIVIEEKESVG